MYAIRSYYGVPRPSISDVLFIEEGGRQEEAEYGIRLLAEEIIEWQKKEKIDKLNVFLPSGTGTTALYLQKNLFTHQSQYSTLVYTTVITSYSIHYTKLYDV